MAMILISQEGLKLGGVTSKRENLACPTHVIAIRMSPRSETHCKVNRAPYREAKRSAAVSVELDSRDLKFHWWINRLHVSESGSLPINAKAMITWSAPPSKPLSNGLDADRKFRALSSSEKLPGAFGTKPKTCFDLRRDSEAMTHSVFDSCSRRVPPKPAALLQ